MIYQIIGLGFLLLGVAFVRLKLAQSKENEIKIILAETHPSEKLQGPAHTRDLTDSDENVATNSILSAQQIAKLKKQVAILILGWGGSTQKQLRRISELYSVTFGLDCVVYISPLSAFMDGVISKKEIGNLLNTIDKLLCPTTEPKTYETDSVDQLSPTRHLVIHSFSNNGAASLSALLHAIHNRDTSQRKIFGETKISPKSCFIRPMHIIGVVFDSAPWIPNHTTYIPIIYDMFKAISLSFPFLPSLINKPVYFHPIWSPLLILVLFFASIIQSFVRILSLWTWPGSFDIMHLLQMIGSNLPTSAHQLYIYSKADKLIPAKSVESFILKQKNRGVAQLETICFPDSPHVRHLLDHKDKYFVAVTNFLEQLVSKF